MAKRFPPKLIMGCVAPIIAIVIISIYYDQHARKSEIEQMANSQEAQLELQSRQIIQYLYPALNDTYFLSTLASDSLALSANISDFLKDDFFLFSNSSKYYQSRILDTLGKEILRVDFSDRKSNMINEDSLQDKSHRSYFVESKDLAPNGIYISSIDLNQEYGEREYPYQPVVRFIRPLVSPQGAIKGSVIINSKVQEVFHEITALTDSISQSPWNTYIVNNDGYWLNDPQKSHSFGFEFEKHQNETLAKYYPGIWRQIKDQQTGHVYDGRDLFVFKRIIYDSLVSQLNRTHHTKLELHGREGFLIIKHIDSERLSALLLEPRRLILYFATFAILLTFGILIAVSRAELQKSQEQLKKTLRNVEQQRHILKLRNTELESFVRVASHDLREPLATIMSVANTLKEYQNKPIDKSYLSYLDFITECAKRMDSLTKGVLDYALSGKPSVLALYDLNKMLGEILQDISHSLEQSMATVSYDKLPTLEVYPLEIKQVFQNIISNSVKYSRPNVPPVIEITLEESSTHYQINVADNGIGIDEENFDLIFDIFRRLHIKSGEEGLGLGLAISKNIIQLHRGEIWVSPNPEGGTIIKFTIDKNLS